MEFHISGAFTFLEPFFIFERTLFQFLKTLISTVNPKYFLIDAFYFYNVVDITYLLVL